MKINLTRSQVATVINALQGHIITLEKDAEIVKHEERLLDDFKKQILEMSIILDKLETQYCE